MAPAPTTLMLDFEGGPAPRGGLTLVERIRECDVLARTLDDLDEDELAPEAIEELTRELLAALTGTRDKVDSTTGVLVAWESAAHVAAREIERLEKRKAHFERNVARLHVYILHALTTANVKELHGHTSTLGAKLNPPKVVIDDEAAVPAEFLRTPPPPAAVPDKAKIKAALAAKTAVAGCRLAQGYRVVVG
jgi:hypothetical protein